MSIIRFIFAAILSIAAFPALALQTMTCISENNAFVHCALPQADTRGVVLTHVISGNCNANGAWGVDSAGVWVNHNCGGSFQYQGRSTTYYDNVEPYAYGWDYGPDYYYGPDYVYPGAGIFFGRGYYYNNGHYHNGNYQHNGSYHGGGHYQHH